MTLFRSAYAYGYSYYFFESNSGLCCRETQAHGRR